MAPLAHRANAADMGRAAPALLGVWIYFNLVANTILLPLLVATFVFSRRVKRHPTLVNVCMTWILSGIFSLLLFYGGQASGPEPEKPLCIAQTALLYGITPMWSVAVMVLLFNMIHVMNEEPGAPPISRAKMIAMLCAPYVVQAGFSTAALVGSLAHPENVNRARRYFYCALRLHPLAMTMTIFTAAIGVCICILMIYLAVLLYRNWHGMRDAGRPSRVHAQMTIRVMIFGAYIVFGLAVNVISMVYTVHANCIPRAVGTVIFLVFGTQADVIRTTVYLPREPSAVPSMEEKRDLQRVWEKDMDAEKAERSIAWGERPDPHAIPPDTPSTQA
ncbi:hypothetical protein C8R46DRAFT_1079956 [Mycena filopes]|nr:hypothetical protein C8R46DRAFT_1079956 [Mycena filopes]